LKVPFPETNGATSALNSAGYYTR